MASIVDGRVGRPLREVATVIVIVFLANDVRGQDPPVLFEDVSGLIDFVHRSSEFEGDGLAGAAWFDYNNDGWLDLFLTNGKTQTNGLFRNNGDGTFDNVAAEAGVENGLGNSGVIAADFDNDGWQDLFLTGEGGSLYGSKQMPLKFYHNNGDGTFSDITEATGLVSPPTALDPAVADIDLDGDLDIFIGAPGSLFLQVNHKNELWLNNGDLTFTNISASSGVDTSLGACAASFLDYDTDGFPDLFIANCNDKNLAATPIELHRNNGDLTFTDLTQSAGTNVPGLWMGLSMADHDNDGDLDVFSTNTGLLNGLWHALLRNNGDGSMTNIGVAAGVGVHRFAWGCSFTDFDNDSWADLFFTGALVGWNFNIIGPGVGNQGTMLFNDGDGTFSNFTEHMPVNLENRYTSGVAYGDYDNDGFNDILVMVETIPGDLGTPVLLHNLGNDNNWVKLRLTGTISNRDAIGARVLVTANGVTQAKEVFAGTSLLSTDSKVLSFGLGKAPMTDEITVIWPSGLVEQFANAKAGATVTLVEGTILCPWDLDSNGNVGASDLLSLLVAWGPNKGHPADFDGNGTVGASDLLALLVNWGPCP
ncbi:MAG: CRTAC1 family protein [Phycisphaerales bacterium]